MSSLDTASSRYIHEQDRMVVVVKSRKMLDVDTESFAPKSKM